MSMTLVERTDFITTLQSKFKDVAAGEGHCILVSGEAGIGKTSLVRTFIQDKKPVYQGSCDALFTPRPLAPLYDIIWQIWGDTWKNDDSPEDRVSLFTRFFHQLGKEKGPILIVFEDIHWADEATHDFIKFLARRIIRIPCLFILTYRDDEIHSLHPLRNVIGQLPSHSFTRMQLTPLSRQAVDQLAYEKGYKGEDVYSISGGNPFYVNEILASYSLGIPDNIKDSILSVYNRLDERVKKIWDILSILPTGLELEYLAMLDPKYGEILAPCLEAKIIYLKDGKLFFKHELYRRTIETSLSPFVRIDLNKKILDTFRESFEQKEQIERIIHHAKNANEYDWVVHYTPIAAQAAAAVGAHIEAAKLYYTAIEYYQGKDKDLLVEFYHRYAYECYLTSRIKEAIIYQTKALNIWKEKGDIEKMGNAMWFLSRLWWFDGNRKQADSFAQQAIDALIDQPVSRAQAMAFSNMSQLRMLSDLTVECIHWGEKAIALAKELNDEEINCHALNNVGAAHMGIPAYKQKGIDLISQSLRIALKNAYHEHAARAYTNLSSGAVKLKDYPLAKKFLTEGITYCEERDLDSWRNYMLSWKSRMLLETGSWTEARSIAEMLAHSPTSIIRISALVVIATIKIRKGEEGAQAILDDARAIAFEAMELQRILPVLTAMLEYEWFTGETIVEKAAIEYAIGLIGQGGHPRENSSFHFWLLKVRKQQLPLHPLEEEYTAGPKTAAFWKELGCPYEEALFLFEGDETEKKEALEITQQLGATAIYEKMKQDMRSAGIKSIPRGARKTTQSNPAMLTERELDILGLLKEGLQNKEIGSRLFISAKTVDHHISAILYKLEVNSRIKAVQEAQRLGILK